MRFIKQGIILSAVFILISCGMTRGTAVDYIPALLAVDVCEKTPISSAFQQRTRGSAITQVMGDDNACLNTPDGNTFYKAFSPERPVVTVLVRSFYATRGEAARVFVPIVNSYDMKTGKITEGVVEYLDDLYSNEDGNFLEVRYIFNKPVEHIIITTDNSDLYQNYDYSERNTGDIYTGGMIISWDFIQSYDIKVNAGGPFELRMN